MPPQRHRKAIGFAEDSMYNGSGGFAASSLREAFQNRYDDFGTEPCIKQTLKLSRICNFLNSRINGYYALNSGWKFAVLSILSILLLNLCARLRVFALYFLYYLLYNFVCINFAQPSGAEPEEQTK